MIDVLAGAWAAGEVKTFHVNGSYFEILECVYPVDVRLLDRQGAVRSDLRQAEASFFSEGLDFATIQITSAQAQNIRSFYGDGTAGTRRTAGVVSVVDGGKARTAAGMAFYAFPYAAAVATQFAHAQLWNPAGSGKNVFVVQLYPYAQGASASGMSIRKTAAALPSLLGNATSKNFGSAALSVSELRSTTNVTPQGVQIGTVTKGAPLKLSEPILITPGSGIVMMSGVVSEDAGCNFEFFEETI